jgi:hypothetical protein
MFNRNTLISGLLAGLLLPLLVAGALFLFFKGLDLMNVMSSMGFRLQFRERTIILIGIVANALLLNRYNKKRYTETMRGVSIITFVYVIAWLILFGKTVI